MVVYATMPLWTGTEIRVKTVPVDPRSMFRGNYAQLRYEFATLPEGALSEVGGGRNGEVVYVRLERGEGAEYECAGVSLEPPSEGIFLRGRVAGYLPPYQVVRYGIEAFFAPKEKALKLEKDLRNGGTAILMVAGSGKRRPQGRHPGSRRRNRRVRHGPQPGIRSWGGISSLTAERMTAGAP